MKPEISAATRKSRKVIAPSLRSSRLLLVGLLFLVLAVAFWTYLRPLVRERGLESASLADLEGMAARNGGDERLLFHIGRRREQSGDPRGAMDAYWRALQIDQSDNSAWQGWVRTTELSLGPAQAQRVAETWLQADPSSADATLSLASEYQKLGNHPLAYDAAAKASTLSPGNAQAWGLMGSEAAIMGEHVNAETAFRKAAAIDPKDWKNAAGLGDALSHLGRSREAIGCFRDAVGLAPSEGAPVLLLGTELLRAAMTDPEASEALRALQTAWDRRSMLPPSAQFQAALMLGDCAARDRNWRDAVQWYEKAKALSPFDPAAAYNLARAYRNVGDEPSAAREFARHATLETIDRDIKVTAIQVDANPGDDAARLRLARLYAKTDQPKRAIRAYQTLLERHPSSGPAISELRSLLTRTGK